MSEHPETRYPAVLETQEKGALPVRFVDLEDTFAEGTTPDEALFPRRVRTAYHHVPRQP